MAGGSGTALGDLVETLGSAQSETELAAGVWDFGRRAGFPLLAYHLVYTAGLPAPTGTHITTYPREWITHYLAEGGFHCDPVVEIARSAVAPFIWPGEDSELNASARRLMMDAADFGIAAGLTIPVRGPSDFALFSVVPENPRDADVKRRLTAMRPELALAAMVIHERGKSLLRKVPLTGGDVVRLSPREREVMQWVAAGKTSWEIGQILHLSEYTVRAYVSTALTKLQCSDRAHGAVRAVLLGLIEPPF